LGVDTMQKLAQNVGEALARKGIKLATAES